MAGELVRAETVAGRALIALDAIDQEAEQRNLLGRYIQTQMQEGSDYGVIPGTKNRTLLKPGAEKLTQLFRCVPRFTVEEKIENWDTGLFFYRFRCEIVTQADRLTVAEGVGSCSTYESRYRWRNADRTCPACGKAAIIKGKAEYGGGYLCFKKKDGCGAKFAENDTAITGQPTGRVQNPDLHDAANTVLKMAKKRALVDAAISLARCSDIFTQDVEDMHFPEPIRPAEHIPDVEVVSRPDPVRPTPDTLYKEAKQALVDAAAESCDRLKAVWVNVYADRQRFGENLWTALELLKDELKAKCQQAKPAAAESFEVRFGNRVGMALSVADLDVLDTELDDTDGLTDTEYSRAKNILRAAYAKFPA
jgi:hypothetical protein